MLKSLETLSSIVERHSDQPAFLFSLIEKWPGLVVLATVEGSVVAASAAWAVQTGITAEDLRLQGWRVFVHPQDLLRSEAEVRGMLQEGRPSLGFKNRYVSQRTGQVTLLSWVATPFRGDLTLAVADLREVSHPQVSP